MYHYIDHKKGIIKEISILIVLFVIFCFVDLQFASFISVFFGYLLMTRRVILIINPGFVLGHKVMLKDKEFSVPKEVDIFDLSNVPSIKFLYKYVEIIGGISVPPSFFIIRFSGMLEIQEFELKILIKVIDRLHKSSIIVILSDVKENIRDQFKRYKIGQKVGNENIFYQITDALILTKRLKAGKPV